MSDRVSIRERPEGSPIMYQSWGKLLFMHWPIPVEALRPLIPERLSVDTFDGKAWIGLIPFTIWNARPIFMPPLPWASDFHEINVRTYVHLDGVPGVWFFSLDANSLVAVLAARTFFHLPYYNARISLEQRDNTITYSTTRQGAGPHAEFNATWRVGPDLPEAKPGSLDFFLVERYCLYASDEKSLYRCRIFHRPWPLQEADLTAYDSTMIEADGLPTPGGEPLLHCAGPVDVEVWPLEEV
ncbi:MAG TPA: DUF2071 domain-containing protein [Blastocatellia bacterium]|nr:DUF2071 domain-containing protein [Blastocatellia bacterium]